MHLCAVGHTKPLLVYLTTSENKLLCIRGSSLFILVWLHFSVIADHYALDLTKREQFALHRAKPPNLHPTILQVPRSIV